MRDVGQPPEKYTLRYQLVAMARDVGTIVGTLVVIGGIVSFLTKPYTQPYIELPKQLAELQIQLAKMQLELAEVREPRIVDFIGHAIVLGHRDKEIFPGSSIRLLYNLRRNASCATDLEIGFINVGDGSRIVTHTQRAVQAPVTEDYLPFILRLRVPLELPPGTWSYQPRLIPIDCGVYRPYLGAISEPFHVRKRDE